MSDSAPIPLLRTKLHRSPVAKDLVCREALHARLEEGCHLPLTLVLAPAVYGKSAVFNVIYTLEDFKIRDLGCRRERCYLRR
jgi:ATP/maltotriose-dependent transcriptional regulator MalT